MATTTGIVLPLQIRASSSAPNHHRRKPPSPPSSSSSAASSTASVSSNNHNNNWWTPLFGWSSDPDYITNDTNDSDNLNEEKTAKSEKRVRSGRCAPGCFTEEKARRMRIMMLDVQEAHHDVMYHSAIASRLASDFSDHR